MEVDRSSAVPSTAHFYGELYCPNAKISFPRELPDPDVYILTSGGLRIPAHSGILALASPVLETAIDRPRKHRGSDRVVPILGVPSDAVGAFVRFIYSSRCTESEMEKYDIHLLALAHVYAVPQLKQRCIKDLSQRLTIENVVDMLQLSRLCNASDLYLRCMKLMNTNFVSVEKTEGWKFLQKHDPQLELDILHFMDESDKRKKKTKRHRAEQSLYGQLSEAMDCLEHICTQGCTHVGPLDMELGSINKESSCPNYRTCQGLQFLFKHFATCQKRSGSHGGCTRCKRVWQLLRLHSCLCDQTETCRVPLCRQLRTKAQQQTRKDDAGWRLLVRKVTSAKAMSSLSQATQTQRKRVRELMENSIDSASNNPRLRTLKLKPNSLSILAR